MRDRSGGTADHMRDHRLPVIGPADPARIRSCARVDADQHRQPCWRTGASRHAFTSAARQEPWLSGRCPGSLDGRARPLGPSACRRGLTGFYSAARTSPARCARKEQRGHLRPFPGFHPGAPGVIFPSGRGKLRPHAKNACDWHAACDGHRPLPSRDRSPAPPRAIHTVPADPGSAGRAPWPVRPSAGPATAGWHS